MNPSASRNNSGSHNYTLSNAENDHLVSLGWRAEGIGWYGANLPSQSIRGFWVNTSAWTGGNKELYWIDSSASIAKDRIVTPSEGTTCDHDVYVTSSDTMLRNDVETINGTLTAATGDGGLIPIASRTSFAVPYTNQDDEGAPTGCTEGRLISELAQGNPVVVWVSYNFVPIQRVNAWYGPSASNWLVVTLMGYDPSTNSFMVSDPASTKHQYWVARTTFDPVWEVQRGAVVVK